VLWNKVTLAGVGLLGGSLGLALRERGLAESVVGFVRRAASVEECVRCGAVSGATCDLEEAVTGADLVVLCTPLAQMRPLVERMLPALSAAAVITDVGSVKGSVVRDLEELVASVGARFVGSHPMAGAEKTGVAAARSDLFVNAVCVVTPTARSHPEAVARMDQLWEAVGGRLLHLSPELHDELVSRSSHLPHVVAAQLAHLVLNPDRPTEQAALCANGFRDATRIASSSPEMWRDIALANRENLSNALEILVQELARFQTALRRGDEPAITDFFTTAKQRRDQWTGRSGANSPE
jgi:prephenate dehydrogenase